MQRPHTLVFNLTSTLAAACTRAATALTRYVPTLGPAGLLRVRGLLWPPSRTMVLMFNPKPSRKAIPSRLRLCRVQYGSRGMAQVRNMM
jgi:hypothetical protein